MEKIAITNQPSSSNEDHFLVFVSASLGRPSTKKGNRWAIWGLNFGGENSSDGGRRGYLGVTGSRVYAHIGCNYPQGTAGTKYSPPRHVSLSGPSKSPSANAHSNQSSRFCCGFKKKLRVLAAGEEEASNTLPPALPSSLILLCKKTGNK